MAEMPYTRAQHARKQHMHQMAMEAAARAFVEIMEQAGEDDYVYAFTSGVFIEDGETGRAHVATISSNIAPGNEDGGQGVARFLLFSAKYMVDGEHEFVGSVDFAKNEGVKN